MFPAAAEAKLEGSGEGMMKITKRLADNLKMKIWKVRLSNGEGRERLG